MKKKIIGMFVIALITTSFLVGIVAAKDSLIPAKEIDIKSKISEKWKYLIKAPFKISDRCCYHLKKYPSSAIQKQGLYPIVGTRADESNQRLQTYYMYGCNAFDLKTPRSKSIHHPLLSRVMNRFLNAFPILQYFLG